MIKRLLGTATLLLAMTSASWGQENTDLVTMDFQSVEMDQIVRFVAEMSGRNFVLNNKVKGEVSMVTPTPVTREEAFQLFEALLDVHGFTIEVGDNVNKIVPVKEAPTMGVAVNGPLAGSASDQVEARLLRLKYADANSLASTLKPLVSSWGHIGANVLTNALIITDSKRNIVKLQAMIDMLDAKEAQLSQRVFPIKYASVAQVEKIINSIYTDFNNRRPKGLAKITAFSDQRSKLLIVLGPKQVLDELDDLVARIDSANTMSRNNFHLYYPQNAKAEEIQKTLTEMLGKLKPNNPEQPVSFNKHVSLVSDSASNVLMVSATADDYEILLPLIKGLDMPRREVFVEAAIVEILGERAKDYGVDWESVSSGITDGSGVIGGSTFGLIDDFLVTGALPQGLSIGVVDSVKDADGNVLSSLSALIRLLESDSDINVLSTPNLLVMENASADISVGQEVPFVTGNQSNTAGNVLQTVERKDVGLLLQVEPRILQGGKLEMDIYNEVSSISQTVITDIEGGLVTNKRSIKTKVILKNAQTIVLGGLIREEENDTVKKVPFLGSIPIMGSLFRSTEKSKTRTNLMVFIRPVIIDDYSELVSISEDKYRVIRQLWNQSDSTDKDLPQLPEKVDTVTSGEAVTGMGKAQ